MKFDKFLKFVNSYSVYITVLSIIPTICILYLSHELNKMSKENLKLYNNMVKIDLYDYEYQNQNQIYNKATIALEQNISTLKDAEISCWLNPNAKNSAEYYLKADFLLIDAQLNSEIAGIGMDTFFSKTTTKKYRKILDKLQEYREKLGPCTERVNVLELKPDISDLEQMMSFEIDQKMSSINSLAKL